MTIDRMDRQTHDQVLIAGAGIAGLALARELVRRGANRILLLEKETHLGAHASRRNGRVLHAGVSYHPGTMKVRFCLEVHFTHAGDGDVCIGPAAIPAIGRENCGLLQGMDGKVLDILVRDAILLFGNSGFRSAAVNEPKKLVKGYVYRQAKRLVPALQPNDIEQAEGVGIRA
jgi:hypothetical protein